MNRLYPVLYPFDLVDTRNIIYQNKYLFVPKTLAGLTFEFLDCILLHLVTLSINQVTYNFTVESFAFMYQLYVKDVYSAHVP